MKTIFQQILILVAALLLTLLLATASASAQDPPAETTPAAAPDVEPELLEFVDAEYPAAALRSGREGTVLLELLVTASGVVDSVTVLEGLAPDLDAAAVDAARRCTFSPALAVGEPVPVLLQLAYTFSVREQARTVTPQVNLRGRLLEMGTRRPLAGAMVVASFPAPDSTALPVPLDVYLERIGGFEGQFLEEGRLVAFADSSGTFAFHSLPLGTVDLSFPNAGYEPLNTTEEIRSDELVEGVFRLRRTDDNVYEIVVYGRQQQKEITRQTLSVTEIERLPGFAGDVIKSVQALPGVARPTMDDPGAIVVRGSGNYDSRFFLDGVDIPLLFHFGGVKSTYNSLALANVDLFPGGFGTRYGGCVGGVIELTGRPGRRDRWHYVGDLSTMDGSFHAEGPIGDDFSFLFTGRRSFIGELAKAALKDNDSIEMSVAPYYWDVVGRLDWQPSDDHSFFVTAFAANDRMEMLAPEDASGSPEVSEATDEIEMDLAFSRYILGWDGYFGDRLHNELRAAWGRSSESGHVLGEFRFDGKGPVWSIRDDLGYELSPALTPHLGLDLVYTDYKYEVKVAGWPASVQDQEFSDIGAYANLEWRPHRNLLLVPGIRRDYYHHLKDAEISLRGNARWDYRPGRAITAAYGSYNQMPQPVGQSTDPVYGNPDLPATRARHAVLGHDMVLGDNLSLKVEAYHNIQDRIPAFADTLGANFLPDQEARMYGLEFMLRHEAGGRFFGWLSYSIGRSERKFARRPSTLLADDWDSDQWVMHDMDQTHHVEAVGSWKLGREWSVGGRVQYVSGVPTTPILGYTGDQYEFDADTGDYVPVEGEYFSDRIEPYFRTDLRVDKRFVKKSSVWSVYLDLQNANYFIHNSPEGYTYNYDYSKRTDYGWIFMPALGLRVEY
ncbi:MAG: TonB-dependent receptor [bacterium]|nr:TonB-dependent receptor [bacterium]